MWERDVPTEGSVEAIDENAKTYPEARPEGHLRRVGQNTDRLWQPDDLCDWVPLRRVVNAANKLRRKARKREEKLHQEWMSRYQRATVAYNASDTRSSLAGFSRSSKAWAKPAALRRRLFRAQKASTRAKRYRGGPTMWTSFSDLAYDRKDTSLKKLCDLLSADSGGLTLGLG